MVETNMFILPLVLKSKKEKSGDIGCDQTKSERGSWSKQYLIDI